MTSYFRDRKLSLSQYSLKIFLICLLKFNYIQKRFFFFFRETNPKSLHHKSRLLLSTTIHPVQFVLVRLTFKMTLHQRENFIAQTGPDI